MMELHIVENKHSLWHTYYWCCLKIFKIISRKIWGFIGPWCTLYEKTLSLLSYIAGICFDLSLITQILLLLDLLISDHDYEECIHWKKLNLKTEIFIGYCLDRARICSLSSISRESFRSIDTNANRFWWNLFF